jgi:hypothetical protein
MLLLIVGEFGYPEVEKLPYMVSLIAKQMPPLNPYRKTGLGHISYVPY